MADLAGGAQPRRIARAARVSSLAQTAIKIAAPSWRPDIHGKADIVEEIVRIVGVDKVPMTPFERKVVHDAISAIWARASICSRLAARPCETVTGLPLRARISPSP